MRVFLKMCLTFVLLFGVVIASVSAIGAQDAATPVASEDPPAQQEIAVNTVTCEDATCETPAPIDGATISSLDPETGDVIDSCEVVAVAAPSGCGLLVPSNEDGSPNVDNIVWDTALVSAGYIQVGDPYWDEYAPVHPNVYTLAFAPEATPEPETTAIAVNVIICDDRTCDVSETVDGAVVISTLPEEHGAMVGECTVDNTAAPEGCGLLVPLNADGTPNTDTITFTAPMDYDSYVYEGDTFWAEYAPVHPNVFTFVIYPADATPVTPTPDATETPVTRLPSTGTGPGADASGMEMLPLLIGLASLLIPAFWMVLNAGSRRHEQRG